MRFAVRIFFKTLRIALHPFMLLWEVLTTPKGIIRTAEKQEWVEQQTRQLVLYQFKTCPFCIKVRREINRFSLPIELRDAQHHQGNRAELLQDGGQVKVPCLQIKDEHGKVQWMYESAEIIRYLERRFSAV